MELGMIGLGRMGANMTERLVPIFQTLAPKDGYLQAGPSGAGHFVKTIPLQPKSLPRCATSSATTPLKKSRPQWRATRTTTCPKV